MKTDSVKREPNHALETALHWSSVCFLPGSPESLQALPEPSSLCSLVSAVLFSGTSRYPRPHKQVWRGVEWSAPKGHADFLKYGKQHLTGRDALIAAAHV